VKKLTSYLSKITIMFSMVFMVTACSLVDKVQDTSSEKIADLVVQYCAETNDYFRTQLREKINLKMAGQATIEVNCSPQVGVLNDGNKRNDPSIVRSTGSGERRYNDIYRLSPVYAEQINPRHITSPRIIRASSVRRPQKTLTAKLTA
jgi:hypothetical protein